MTNKSFINHRVLWLLIPLLTLFNLSAWGDETFDFSSGTYNSGTITWTGTSCTIVQSKGGSNTNVNSNYTGTNLRWYASHDITFTPNTGVTITQIVLVGLKSGNNSYYGQTMTEQTSTSATITNTSTTTTTVTGTWTPAAPLTLRMGSQFRLKSVTITYSSGCTNGTITYSKGSTTYTGGNAISGSHANDTKVCSTNLTLPGATFTTTGYTQDGWATSDGGAKVYNLSATNYSTEGNATLYPHWAANNYTVTWMNNGSQHTTTQVAYGSKPTFPSNPSSCDGTSTTFIGWTPTPWSGKFDDVSDKTIYTSGTAMPNVSGPVTYHAVFAKGEAAKYEYIGDDNVLEEEKTYIFVSSKSAGSAYAMKASDLQYSQGTLTGVSVTVASVGGHITVGTIDTNLEFLCASHSDDWDDLEEVANSGRFLYIDDDGLGYYTDGYAWYDSKGLQGTDADEYIVKVYLNGTSFTTAYSPSSRVYAYEKKASTFEKYLTTCCTELGSINGSFW